MITLIINGEEKKYQEGVLLEEVAKEHQHLYDSKILLVILNGKIRELSKRAETGGMLSFLTIEDAVGHKTYVRTATFLMMKAIQDVVGMGNLEKIKVEFAIGAGYFCSYKGNFKIEESFINAVNKRIQELVDGSLPIIKKSYPVDQAVELFTKQGMADKVKLLRYRRSSVVNVYQLGDYYDYYYGYMMPDSSYMEYFQVYAYKDGIILMLPTREMPNIVSPPEERDKLFQILHQASEWGVQLGIDTVGDLNNQICEGKLNDLILVQESLQESRIGEIAAEIVARDGVKMIMIAGPSSSGKTTFSHRLAIQLRARGLKPHPIAVDDYFVNRENTPRDENGDYNFECLEAIDVERFNQDMLDLLAGNQVELPSFDFKTGKREYKGNFKNLSDEDVLVIEGIHALNDKMSYALPDNCKYKIYISALTTLNIDEHNRIPTTDGRLLRRMVRDARTRGASAKRTISMWPSVRRGEESNIFPYQESADAMFNSTLIYELAVLKQFAEPLLYSIEKDDPEFHEAKRLLKFLEYFLGVSSEHLPNNSIIREFVGGSCFHV